MSYPEEDAQKKKKKQKERSFWFPATSPGSRRQSRQRRKTDTPGGGGGGFAKRYSRQRGGGGGGPGLQARDVEWFVWRAPAIMITQSEKKSHVRKPGFSFFFSPLDDPRPGRPLDKPAREPPRPAVFPLCSATTSRRAGRPAGERIQKVWGNPTRGAVPAANSRPRIRMRDWPGPWAVFS